MRVFTADYYRGERYKEYLLLPYWEERRVEWLYNNPRASCWICEQKVIIWDYVTYWTSNLLPHHERYDNLFHERLFRDIFILCFNCHSQLHKYRFLFFWEKKTPNRYRARKRRRLFMRMTYVIQKRKFGLSCWYILRYLISL